MVRDIIQHIKVLYLKLCKSVQSNLSLVSTQGEDKTSIKAILFTYFMMLARTKTAFGCQELQDGNGMNKVCSAWILFHVKEILSPFC